jgi:hypothetical protein
MSYHCSKTLTTSFDDAISRVTEALRKEGFGVCTISRRQVTKPDLKLLHGNTANARPSSQTDI